MVDFMSHGGDGGNQDPDRYGHRLSPPCKLELSAPLSKRRGMSRKLNVERRFKAKLYKNYKSKTHKQYKRRDKSQILKAAKRFMAISQRNMTKQAMIPYHCLQGSKNIMSTGHVNRNPETQEWDFILDTWKSIHTRQTSKGEVWVSEQAERQYYVMLQARETLEHRANSLGTQFDEHNVIQEGLEETSPAVGESERIAELEQIVATHKIQLADIQSQLARINSLMALIFPGIIFGSYLAPTGGVGPSAWADKGDDDDSSDSDFKYYESDDDDFDL